MLKKNHKEALFTLNPITQIMLIIIFIIIIIIIIIKQF